ncbi:MAG: HEAT repeat domain-containing protein [Candidatus Binataceae bacterium]
MSKSRSIFGAAAVCVIFLALPVAARAQTSGDSYGGQGLGSAIANSPMMHQGLTKAGVDDVAGRADKESAFKIIKDVKLGLKDADPNVRVAELNKLRNIQDPEADQILIESLADPDLRVKIKALDILGYREANTAVEPISQMLFLRSTEQAVKLHAVAALGRIGDSQGTLPIIQYSEEETDEQGRGTAVFALGEIGNDKATPYLVKTADEDPSAMVRRLSKEALQKIDGELPTQRSTQVAVSQQKPTGPLPTDQKLAKLRDMDQKIQDMDR